MRIMVILGRVLDPAGISVSRRVGRIFVNRETYLLQPADRCGLEIALKIKDDADAEVVVVPRGPFPDDDVLRQALAMGADRAIYLTGEMADAADEAVMARVLAATVERLGGADLVLSGATAMDTGQAQLGPRLAEALGWPQVLDGWAVRVTDGEAEVICREDGGYVSRVVGLPTVVTVVPGALKPRYPDGVRLVNVYRGVGEVANALEAWDVADLVEEEALQPILEARGKDFPPLRELGVRLSGTPEEMAQTAADTLRQRVGR